jgi:uncharacterized protein YdhG (YjbR/CyaY superfamily)
MPRRVAVFSQASGRQHANSEMLTLLNRAHVGALFAATHGPLIGRVSGPGPLPFDVTVGQTADVRRLRRDERRTTTRRHSRWAPSRARIPAGGPIALGSVPDEYGDGGCAASEDRRQPPRTRSRLDSEAVSAEEVDEYLRGLDEPKRSTLQALRSAILEIVPDAEQVISYRVPAFRVHGKTVAGFAAFQNHLSYLPFSGSVLPQLAGELESYTMTKSALHFPVDRPLPKTLVRRLIKARLEQAPRSR